jgi:dTDP-4-amino-4,6-dideoxygalactose transaminase
LVSSIENRVVETLREVTGRRYIHLCGSGTSAILFALKALKCKGEVLMPALLCVNPGSAAVYAGCRPTFYDVERHTYNGSPESLEASITNETACIIAVHEHGEPCDIEAIEDISQRRRVPLIEDSAKALGVKAGSCSIGGFGDLSIFSFGRGKPVEIEGGGGAVATDDPRVSTKLQNLIESHPYITVDEDIYYRVHRALFYAVRDAALQDPEKFKQYAPFVETFRDWYVRSPKGLNWGMLVNELEHLEENVEWRRRAAVIYEKSLRESKSRTPTYTGKGSYVRYPVLVGNSNSLGPKLRGLGFDSNELIPPVNNMFNHEEPLRFFENSEYLYQRQLILWPYVDEERVEKCAEIVYKFATSPD